MNNTKTASHDKSTDAGTTEHGLSARPKAISPDLKPLPWGGEADIRCEILVPARRPLLTKFYRNHRSPMRPPQGAQSWVARQQDIVAALNLSQAESGYWLSGLLVAQPLRRQGLASRLIEHALGQTPEPVWLFCHPDLIGFYRRQGFEPATALPETLAQRLARYQRHKALAALVRTGVHPRDEPISNRLA